MARSIAEQNDAELGGATSILVRQKRDHVRLDQLLVELGAATGEAAEETLQTMMRLVFSHAFAEEAVLWPVLRRELPDGQELTLRVEREHQEVNELTKELRGTVAGDPRRRALVERLTVVLRDDVRDEEDVLLPRLQQALTPKQLRRLGVSWEAVRRTAPTRPHPDVSRRPPGNVLAAVPLTLLDRSQDVVDRLARHGDGRGAGALRGGSRLLAAAADRVEHLRPMRRGEHPSTHTSAPEDEHPG